MPIAAVPDYIAKHLDQGIQTASPGLRFGLYLPIWTGPLDWEKEVRDRARKGSPEARQIAEFLDDQGMDATIRALQKVERNPVPGLWQKNDHGAKRVWQKILPLNAADKARTEALAQRQAAQATRCNTASLLTLDARACAPFVTGLGNEHPLENGFAFLKPYGLPYLPGSGVKGVLRQAARELANDAGWNDTAGWSDEKNHSIEVGKKSIRLSIIDALFGRETDNDDTDQVRGALTFWDVIPRISGGRLAVDIMTPHQSHYYQSGDNPHDSGQPNPIKFLTVPPGSDFTFHVQCNRPLLEHIAPDLVRDDLWKELLQTAFRHAFDWCGFGAKTAVGYGAMALDESKQEQRMADEEAKAQEERLASLSPEDRRKEEANVAIREFITAFEKARQQPFQAGGTFSAYRKSFLEQALSWEDSETRAKAAEALFASATNQWGRPGKKSWKKFRDDVNRLIEN